MSTIKVDTLQTRSGSTSAVTGAGSLKVDNLRGNTAAASITLGDGSNTLGALSTAGGVTITGEGGTVTTNLQQGLAKHWCSLNGTSTVAIRDSFNTASLVDSGTGTYSITSSNAFATAGDQCVTAAIVANKMQIDSAPSATVTTVVSKNASNSNTDSAYVSISCTGDLA